MLKYDEPSIGVLHVAYQLDVLQVLAKVSVEPLHMPWVRQVHQLPL